MSPRCFPAFSVQVCIPCFLSFPCSLTMFSLSACSYWRLPPFAAGKDCERALTIQSDCIDWLPRPRSPEPLPSGQSQENIRAREICEVLSTNDFYHILGITRAPAIDRLTLRRAYLSRSKACHPEFVPLFFFFFLFLNLRPASAPETQTRRMHSKECR